MNHRESCDSPSVLISSSARACHLPSSLTFYIMCPEDPKTRRPRRRSSIHSSNLNRHRLQSKSPSASSCRSLQQAWLASRTIPRRRGTYLMPGAQRPVNETNIRLAITISRACVFDLVTALWGLHPVRTSLMMILQIIRGFFPAFRGYSQAMIVDEVRRD